jgi:putative ABC transport system substrate-binding protein
MRRRDFIKVAGYAAAWPVTVSAQQPAMPVVGFLGGDSPDLYADLLGAFRQGLKETGYVEGQNLAIEYRWAEGHNDRLSAFATDLVRRQVAVIVTAGTPSALAAKEATAAIPIFFCSGRPGRAWTCRPPEPTRWQPHGYDYVDVGSCFEMAGAVA